MCRNVRKLSGFYKPSKMNEPAFDLAVESGRTSSKTTSVRSSLQPSMHSGRPILRMPLLRSNSAFSNDLAESVHLAADRGREFCGRTAHGFHADSREALPHFGALQRRGDLLI